MDESMGAKLMDLGFRENFMNFTQKSREIKAKINEIQLNI